MNAPTSPALTPEPRVSQDQGPRPALTVAAPAVSAKVAPIKPAPVLAASPPRPVSGPLAAPARAAPPVAVPTIAAVPRIWTPASPSRLRRRHVGLLASFIVLVLAPLAVVGWYLYARAVDQYASTLGFSVHRESMDSAFSLVTGLASISGSSSPDTDIIYRYIYSQELVAQVDAEIDLRTIWNKAEGDFVFAFGQDGKIEDLVDYWEGMVKVNYDNTARLIEVRVLAFTPEDARKIASLIYQKSTEMINRLNDAALQDAVEFTAGELDKTRENLVAVRQAMTAFRNEHQLVDPAADVAAQMALVGSLEQTLAQAQIELDLLRETVNPNDPRIPPLARRIEVIEAQIKAERAKLGIGADAGTGTAIADIVAEYERLRVDQEFAEAAYHAARAAHESALSEAQRQSRYLAAHILPTLAESSRYPDRATILGLTAGILFVVWSIAALLFYSLRDRR